jgi:diguanylate cyclase (GGDEF)-like protein
LNLIRLNRIKAKILVFALIATLIPSFTMGWLSYRNNRRVLEEKVAGELAGLTSHSSSLFDFFLKDRQIEVRVFKNSEEVTLNLRRVLQGSTVDDGVEDAAGRLVAYLESVGQKTADYKELVVVDLEGNPVLSTLRDHGPGDLPENWRGRLDKNEPIVCGYHWDQRLGEWVVLVAEPISDPQSGDQLGVLVARLGFETIREYLETSVTNDAHEIFLMTDGGLILASSEALPASSPQITVAPADARKLFDSAGEPHEYDSFRGNKVIGVLSTMDALGWGVVAHIDRERAYSRIASLRNVTFLLTVCIALGIGLAAYLLGMTIVRPLDRLTAGATGITEGKLDVHLPVYSRGELGAMTVAFNRMAMRLRQVLGELDDTNKALIKKNEELHELSITDSLTGLNNRKHMMETLESEGARAVRYNHPYSILMIDIDGFKTFNDTYGHLAGDEVLREVAATLKHSLRAGDYAARYGGEEFLILLPETGPEDAALSAERLRQRVEATFGVDEGSPEITVSVGVASFPDNGSGPEHVLVQADTAMYSAKRAGRNRVSLAKGKREAGGVES